MSLLPDTVLEYDGPPVSFVCLTGRPESTIHVAETISTELSRFARVVPIPFGETGYMSDINQFLGERVIDTLAYADGTRPIVFLMTGITTLAQVRMVASILPTILGPQVNKVSFIYNEGTDVSRLREETGKWPLLSTDDAIDTFYAITKA